VFVTHDVEEALKLADLIVVMKDGRIEQSGTAIDLLHRPATPYVRQLMGADDILQRLSVLPVGRVMQPVAGAADVMAGLAEMAAAREPAAGAGTTESGGAQGRPAGDGPTLPHTASVRDALAALLSSDLKPVSV